MLRRDAGRVIEVADGLRSRHFMVSRCGYVQLLWLDRGRYLTNTWQ